MPTFDGAIEGFVLGDTLTVTRQITLPAGISIDKAWLTVKVNKGDTDAQAKFQLAITAVLSAAGQITDTGSTANNVRTATVRFFLSSANTNALQPANNTTYNYDIQIRTTGGAIYTPEVGTIAGVQGVTDTTA